MVDSKIPAECQSNWLFLCCSKVVCLMMWQKTVFRRYKVAFKLFSFLSIEAWGKNYSNQSMTCTSFEIEKSRMTGSIATVATWMCNKKMAFFDTGTKKYISVFNIPVSKSMLFRFVPHSRLLLFFGSIFLHRESF